MSGIVLAQDREGGGGLGPRGRASRTGRGVNSHTGCAEPRTNVFSDTDEDEDLLKDESLRDTFGRE